MEIIFTLEKLYPAYYEDGKVITSLSSIWRYAGGQLDLFILLMKRSLSHEIMHHLIRKEDIEYEGDECDVIEEVIRSCMPWVICSECGFPIHLDATTYWDAEGIDVRCIRCGALHCITLRDGKLKRMETKERAKAKEEWLL